MALLQDHGIRTASVVTRKKTTAWVVRHTDFDRILGQRIPDRVIERLDFLSHRVRALSSFSLEACCTAARRLKEWVRNQGETCGAAPL